MGKTMTKRGRLHYGWLVMVACGLIQLGDIGIFSNCGGVFIQPVCDELGFARADFQLYMSIITLTMAVTMPLAQRVLARANLRVLVSGAIALECVAFGMMSQYHSVYGWYLSGLVLGLGHAYLTYLLLPFVLNNWFKVRYGLALGLACCCSTLGGAIFSPITGLLIQNFGWRNTYIILAVCAFIIAFPSAAIVLRRAPEEKGLKPYGEGEEPGEHDEESVIPSDRGFTLGQALRSPLFWCCGVFVIGLALTCDFLNYISSMAHTLGFPVSTGAMIQSLVLWAAVLGDPISGSLRDRFGAGTAIGTLMSLGILGLLIIRLSGGMAVLVCLGAFLFGLGFSLLNMAPPLLVKQVVGEREYGRIYSYIASLLTLASASAAFIYGKIYDVHQSYDWALIFAIVSLSVSVLISLYIQQRNKNLWTAPAE